MVKPKSQSKEIEIDVEYVENTTYKTKTTYLVQKAKMELIEFLPKDGDIENLSYEMNRDYEEVLIRAETLKEVNPMMGHRGCRLCITFPEIARMQARAIMEAALEISTKTGVEITPEIMVPLIDDVKELKFIKSIIIDEIEHVFAYYHSRLQYRPLRHQGNSGNTL